MRYSNNGSWVRLLNDTDLVVITTADMNGDGWDDIMGSWTGSANGVWWRNSVSGVWTRLHSMADQIAAGDINGQEMDDLIGLWPGVPGLWVRYQETGAWSRIHKENPSLFTTGRMR